MKNFEVSLFFRLKNDLDVTEKQIEEWIDYELDRSYSELGSDNPLRLFKIKELLTAQCATEEKKRTVV